MRVALAISAATRATLGAAFRVVPRSLPVCIAGTRLQLPRPPPPANMRAGFAWRGGGVEPRRFGMDVAAVEPPQGVLLPATRADALRQGHPG